MIHVIKKQKRFLVNGCLLGTLTCLALNAQAIVNVESLRSDALPQGLSGSVSLFINGASGNSDITSATTGGHLNWQQEAISTMLIARYSYGESNNVRDTNKTFIHLRHIIPSSDQRALELFAQAEKNEFTRMSLRTLVGAGIRQAIYSGSNLTAKLGAGAFYSTEKLEDKIGLTDGGTEQLWRGNFYLALEYTKKPNITLSSTSYYQPDSANFDDYRLLQQNKIQFGITDHLAARLTLDIAHDSQPPQSIKSTDVNYLSGVEYTF